MPTLKKTVQRPWQPERGVQEGRLYPNTKLEQCPLCEECQRRGITTLAQVVDHIVPINRGGAKLDMANLQSLCYPCHNRVGHRIAHKITNT